MWIKIGDTPNTDHYFALFVHELPTVSSLFLLCFRGNEVSATMLATYEDGRPENVEFIRVTFNQWGVYLAAVACVLFLFIRHRRRHAMHKYRLDAHYHHSHVFYNIMSGKIEEIFNVSPTSPECPGMLPTAPDDDEAPAAKKAKKGGR